MDLEMQWPGYWSFSRHGCFLFYPLEKGNDLKIVYGQEYANSSLAAGSQRF